MEERKQMIKDILYELMFHSISLVSWVILIITWDISSNFIRMILIFLGVLPSVSRFCVYDRVHINPRICEGPDMFELNYVSEKDLMNRIRENANVLGYQYEKKLETFYDEIFTILTKENPDEVKFTNKKIGVYRAKTYLAETYLYTGKGVFEWDPPTYSDRKKLAEIRPQYRQMYRLVCGKWGRRYFLPKEWVPMEMILIVIVDEWNYSLQYLLDVAEQLPFVLFSVINVNQPEAIYIAKDNRKEKKDDYAEIRQELFNVLGIDGIPIKEEERDKILYASK